MVAAGPTLEWAITEMVVGMHIPVIAPDITPDTAVTVGTVVMADMAATGMAADTGGVIHATVGDGVGDLGSVGRIGVGDGDIHTATTARGMTIPTRMIPIRTIVRRATHVPRMATIRHQQIPPLHQARSLGDHRRARQK